MPTSEGRKAEIIANFMVQIEGNWGSWEIVANLARQVLELDREHFNAAAAWQAACVEITARLAEELYQAPVNSGTHADLLFKVRTWAQRAAEANGLVRELSKKQGR